MTTLEWFAAPTPGTAPQFNWLILMGEKYCNPTNLQLSPQIMPQHEVSSNKFSGEHICSLQQLNTLKCIQTKVFRLPRETNWRQIITRHEFGMSPWNESDWWWARRGPARLTWHIMVYYVTSSPSLATDNPHLPVMISTNSYLPYFSGERGHPPLTFLPDSLET